MPLGERLVAANLVTKDDVAEALSQQKSSGGSLGDNLVRLGVIDRDRLEAFLEQGPPRVGGWRIRVSTTRSSRPSRSR